MMKKNQTGGSLEARAAGALSFPHVTFLFFLLASLLSLEFFSPLSLLLSLSLSVSCSLPLFVSRSLIDVTSWTASVCQCCARRWFCAWARPAWRPAAGAERRAARDASVAAESRSRAWSPLRGETGEIKDLFRCWRKEDSTSWTSIKHWMWLLEYEDSIFSGMRQKYYY